MDKTSLGDRMKGYENIERKYLTKRTPMIIRIDGCHFHTFTKDFDRPFDISLSSCMADTARQLCRDIMGAKLAYTQSDEISLLVMDDDTYETQPWFDKNLQKITSVSAAIATLDFNHAMKIAVECGFASKGLVKAFETFRPALFDSRAFTLPREEALNYFIWRQRDCEKNSIQTLARMHFTQKELYAKKCSDIREMLLAKGIDWDNVLTQNRLGVCVKKGEDRKWFIDYQIPIFHDQPEYIEDLVYHRGENNEVG